MIWLWDEEEMKTFVPLTFAAASAMLLLPSCDSSRKDARARETAGLRTLGIYGATVHGDEINNITVVQEVDGVRTELMVRETEGKDITIQFQLGLPGKTMRLALTGNGGTVTSGFMPDIITSQAFSSDTSPILKPGEHVLAKTQDEKLPQQNKILLIAK